MFCCSFMGISGIHSFILWVFVLLVHWAATSQHLPAKSSSIFWPNSELSAGQGAHLPAALFSLHYFLIAFRDAGDAIQNWNMMCSRSRDGSGHSLYSVKEEVLYFMYIQVYIRYIHIFQQQQQQNTMCIPMWSLRAPWNIKASILSKDSAHRPQQQTHLKPLEWPNNKLDWPIKSFETATDQMQNSRHTRWKVNRTPKKIHVICDSLNNVWYPLKLNIVCIVVRNSSK